MEDMHSTLFCGIISPQWLSSLTDDEGMMMSCSDRRIRRRGIVKTIGYKSEKIEEEVMNRRGRRSRRCMDKQKNEKKNEEEEVEEEGEEKDDDEHSVVGGVNHLFIRYD